MPRIADVANTWPFEPTDNTTMEATTTIKSENKNKTVYNNLYAVYNGNYRTTA